MPTADRKFYPLTNSQKAIEYLYNISPMKCMMNIPTSAFFEGDYDEELFRKALKLACERCDSFDIRFHKNGKEIQQYFEHSEPVIGDWDFSSKKDASAMEKAIYNDTVRDLLVYDAPLYSLCIIKSHDGMLGAYLNAFHMIMDNIAICMLWTDFMSVYNALLDNKELPAPPVSYESQLPNDYEYFNSERYISDREYWTQLYETMPEPTFTGLSGKQYLDAYRKKVNKPDIKYASTICLNSKSRHDIHVMPAELLSKVMSYCEKHRVSLNAVLETATGAYLAQVNEVDSVFVPAVTSCRATKAERTSGGTRVNMSFVKIDCDRGTDFTDNCKNFMINYYRELRYSKFPYVENLRLMHEIYNNPTKHNYHGFFISCQPYRFPIPKNIKLHTMWHCIGHSLTSVYVTIMDDDGSGGLRFYYDLPEAHGTPEFIKYCFDTMMDIIRKGIESDRPLGEIMAEIPPVPIKNFKLPILA